MITGLSRHLTAQLSTIQVKAMTQHFIIFAFFAPNFRLELAVGTGGSDWAATGWRPELKTEAVAAAARRGNDRLGKTWINIRSSTAQLHDRAGLARISFVVLTK